MQIPELLIRPFVLLAMAILAGSALAQPSPKKAANPALAALHAIDDYEASLETWVPYPGKADFEEREKASGHQAKLERAQRALEKVSDPDLHNDLDILLSDTGLVVNAGVGLVLDANDKSFPKATAQFHSDRDLVATEITTGKRGLLRDAILKRYHKKG